MERQTIYLDGVAASTQQELLAAIGDLHLVAVPKPAGQTADALQPALAVICVAREGDPAFGLVSALAATGTRVAVLAPTEDASLVMRALRAGAREFVAGPDPKRLELAVRNLARPVPGAASGLITTVFAPKGGVGATTLAVNVGAAVAASGERSCVVDLDLQLGDTLSFLDIQGGYTVSDVLANIRRLDRDLVDASIAKHRTGVAVLAQTERIEEAEQIDAGEVGRLLTFLRPHFAHVFVDGIRAFDEIGLAALDAADRILIPVTQEVPAVRSAQRCVDVFRKLGYAETKVQVVVNRFHKSSNITCDVIAETIGVPVAATVANDYAALQRAMHGGKTLQEEAPRSAAARDVQALAQLVGGVRAPRPRGVLERLFSKGEAHGAR